MTQPALQLLRRTFMAAAAFAAIAGLSTAHAGNLKNQDNGTVICTSFANVGLDAAGNLTVSGCTTTSTAGPAGAIDFQVNTSVYPNGALALNSTYSNALSLVRSGGTTGSVTVNFTRSGGCGPLPLQDTATVPGGTTSVAVTMRTPNNNAICKATITSVLGDGTATSAPTVGTTLPVATMTVSSSGTPPGGTTTGGGGGGGGGGGCPTNTGVAITGGVNYGAPISFGGNDAYKLASGQIGYVSLPTLAQIQASIGGYLAANFQINDTSSSPVAGTKEVWISKCPGTAPDTSVTNPPHGKCYVSSNTWGVANSITWFATTGPSGAAAADAAADNAMNTTIPVCEAYDSNGPWYVNLRLTYQPSDCLWGTCGVTAQFGWPSTSPP